MTTTYEYEVGYWYDFHHPNAIKNWLNDRGKRGYYIVSAEVTAKGHKIIMERRVKEVSE